MGVVGLLGLLIGSFAILYASVSSESSSPEYSAADGETRALVLEVEHLKGETARLKGKLEDVGVSEEEVAALRRRLGDVEVRLTRVESAAIALESCKGKPEGQLGWTMEEPTENVSTVLSVNAPAWELGGQTEFNVSQTMGGWQLIELFLSVGRPSLDPCEERIFNLRGSTVEWTWRWGCPTRERNVDLTLDTHLMSPHHWSGGWFTFKWLTTDYANWGALMECYSEELSSCRSLFILARERTLPPATLEMLRNVAVQRGFPKADGVLVDQTFCCSEGEEKAEENATLKWTMEVTTENASTAFSVNAPAWELGGQTAFNVPQAMGGWHLIEVFLRGGRPSPILECWEFILNLRGSTVERTWSEGKSGDKEERKANYTLDSQSPHQWTREGWGLYTWVTTDYANWAVVMSCVINDRWPCGGLLILSRERTMRLATLEMLRNVAEHRGFPRANGALVNQTSC